MQQVPLLQTKLHIPPVRRKVVSRPRLMEQLSEGLGRTLTLISAPAGFGKTTMVSEWASHFRLGIGDWGLGSSEDESIRNRKSQIANRVAWLSLDEGDSDPARFLTYLIAALRTVDPEMGTGALSALQSPQSPPVEAVLTSLINEIATIPDRMVLVLDDYHLIAAQPIHDTLSFLLEHLPPPPGGLHLVIATREDPLLPVAGLRARGQLAELRATDLRFFPSEAAEFLNQAMGLDLSEEDIAALERRTEGWIAGLHLAAISMQGHKDTSSFIKSFTGSHHYVLDYLIEEVLEQQPESVQTCLLQTAILDRLTASLCDAVCFVAVEMQSSSHGTGVSFSDTESADHSGGAIGSRGTTAKGWALLDRLDRANLFIVPLDDERQWYRYHHLFADLLRRRLHQTQPEWVPALHLRASEWFEQSGFDDEAIEHALRAGEVERATHLIEELVDALGSEVNTPNCDAGWQSCPLNWHAPGPTSVSITPGTCSSALSRRQPKGRSGPPNQRLTPVPKARCPQPQASGCQGQGPGTPVLHLIARTQRVGMGSTAKTPGRQLTPRITILGG